MDELIDILDTEGKFTGQTTMKSNAHQKGLFHPTIHVWFYTKDGQVLIQKRGKDKATFPLLWDVSVAGHVGSGEAIEKSAIREIEEEIGLIISEENLQKIGVFKSEHQHGPNFIDCEFHHTYLCKLNVPLTQLKKQDSEVDALSMIPIAQFESEINDDLASQKYVPHHAEYYQTILTAIKTLL
ncbi:NUDIX hydrolase [Spongiimicrobium sp. 3-5]|uniref:NUDIX hydrolase n=1 Tax=Spongiimicrobium sp. 3-5 TaxID=3332596 RepID=UPI00397FD0B4